MATGWAPGRVGLYRLYDADLTLLYAGIGEFPEVRWKAHSKSADWWPEVDLRRSIIVWFDSRREAEAAEIVTIQTEDPLYNVTHSLRHRDVAVSTPGTYASQGNDLRRFRMHQQVWDTYGEVVGETGRSADLRAYMNWRANNPDTPLPGRRMGPVVRRRPKPSEASAA